MHSTLFHRFSLNGPALPEAQTHRSGVRLEQRGAMVTIEIPFSSVERVFYRIGPGELVVSTDMRVLSSEGDSLDDDGVLSLLVLGGCIPPLTPFRPVRTFLPGFTHRIDLSAGRISSKASMRWSEASPDDATLAPEGQVAILKHELDRILLRQSEATDPIVLFSGGVDSSVLAARLKAIGQNRTSLVHCSFGEAGSETPMARAIAHQLGLSLRVIHWGSDSSLDALEKAAATYSTPFVDSSCVPARTLADAIANEYPAERIVFDGTGADGGFGLWWKTSLAPWITAIPRFVRQPLARLYENQELWRREGVVERRVRLIRRSTQLRPLAFLITQHPLGGIGFPLQEGAFERISSLCEGMISGVARTGELAETFPLLDLAFMCAGVYIPKNQVYAADHGFTVHYPFMDPDIIDLALSHAMHWPGSMRPKNAMKLLLAEFVSPDLIHRPKYGFAPPLQQLLSHPIVMENLAAAIEPNAVLFPYLKTEFIHRALAAIRLEQRLPSTTYNFLWGVAFCNAWLTQIPAEARRFKQLGGDRRLREAMMRYDSG